MSTNELVTPGSITSKIITFFIFIAIEIIANTITFFFDASPHKINNYMPGSGGDGKYTIFALALMG